MSRARIDLGGAKSRSSGGGGGGAGADKQKLIKGAAAHGILLVAAAVVVWQLDLIGGPPRNDGVNVPSDPNASATPENPAPTQPTADAGNTDSGYGDDSAAAAAPPKKPERRGGGYINPDAPKDPE